MSTFGKTKSGQWIDKYAGRYHDRASKVISSINASSHLMAFLHECGNHELVGYTNHIRRQTLQEYLHWKKVVRRQFSGKLSDILVAYVRQRFRPLLENN